MESQLSGNSKGLNSLRKNLSSDFIRTASSLTNPASAGWLLRHSAGLPLSGLGSL